MRALVRVDLPAAVVVQAARVADLQRVRVVRVVPVSRVGKGAPDLRKMQEALDRGRKEMTGNPKGLRRTSLA